MRSRKALALLLMAGVFLFGLAARYLSWQTFVVPEIDGEIFGLSWYKYIYYPTYNRLDSLLAGVAIATIMHGESRLKQFIVGNANIMLLAGIAVLVAAYFFCENMLQLHTSLWGYPLVALGFGLLVASSIQPRGLLNRFTSTILTKIATLSYAIYLTHKAIIHLTQQQATTLGIADDSSTMFLFCIATCVLAALILHYVVERPFLRIRQRLTHHKVDT